MPMPVGGGIRHANPGRQEKHPIIMMQGALAWAPGPDHPGATQSSEAHQATSFTKQSIVNRSLNHGSPSARQPRGPRRDHRRPLPGHQGPAGPGLPARRRGSFLLQRGCAVGCCKRLIVIVGRVGGLGFGRPKSRQCPHMCSRASLQCPADSCLRTATSTPRSRATLPRWASPTLRRHVGCRELTNSC